MGFDLETVNKTGRSLEDLIHSLKVPPEAKDDPLLAIVTLFDAIISNGDNFRWNNEAWHRLLDLAQSYGWEPAGTQAPQAYKGDWSGTYTTNEGQLVTAEDAAALADAIERALDDIPDHQVPGKWAELQPVKSSGIEMTPAFDLDLQGNSVMILGANPNMHPFELFSGDVKQQRLIPFIKFCRKGAFWIA